jgi:probable addiction module antidote protein
MTTVTYPFDASEHLDTPEAIQEYLAAAFETEDPAFIADALGVIAKSFGMTRLAQDTGLSRPALYKALNSDGNPEFATIMKVAHALGFTLVPTRTLEHV